MTTPEIKTNKYTTIARLFKLISNISEEQLLILVKELLKDRFTAHLFRLIVEMTDDQQLKLIKQLEEVSAKSGNPDKRSQKRKPCLISVDYMVGNRKFKSFMLDISTFGVFIETKNLFPVGKEIIMSFTLSNHQKPFKLTGEIIWSGSQGIGAKFKYLNQHQFDIIKSYSEKMDEIYEINS
ncbi:MAG: PilZ domain-containing protein [Thermodesulfobacteriota bacterium]|nr:PilZ domain-containing protein [Thermodesulfobacteriota bacterium]